MSVSFSVALIAKNEAPNLWRLHKSLAEFLRRDGEVVLLDTGSTDNTPAVARGLGFKVFEVGERFLFEIPESLADSINRQFIIGSEERIVSAGDRLFDYSAARNHSARMAINDVVSMPDCDEQYTNLDIDKIEEAIKAGYEQMEFHFIFAHYPNGQPAVQFRQCKMYDRRKMHWQGIVHEVLVGNAKRTYLPPNVLLLEHFQAPQTHRSRYLPGLAMDCYLNQDNDRNSHYLGRELLWTGRPKSAIRELTRHVGMNRWPSERSQSMIFIGDAHATLGEDEKALDSYHKAFLMDGTRREPLLRLATHFWKKNDFQKTACYASASLEIPPNDAYMNVGAHYTYEPHERLYWALWWLGDRNRSKEHWEKAIAYDPTNPKFISDKQFYCPVEYGYKDNGIQGWMLPGELDWLCNQAKKVGSIVEIGSWKGRSSHALLTGCKGKVTCVDTFKGSMDPRDSTNQMAKVEDVYTEFTKNVGHFPNLEICRMESSEAAAKFSAEGRKFDMVFIDAGHTYEEVKRDIELWKDKAIVILSGHDYLPQTWMGVCQAVDECVGSTYKAESIWYAPAVPLPKIKGRYPESLAEMQGKIEDDTPFSFVKSGDGEQQCMEGVTGRTLDGQNYSFELNLALRKAYAELGQREDTYLTNWKDWLEKENDGRILLHRENRDWTPLRAFYGAIRASFRKKVFIGPSKLYGVARMLKADFIKVPPTDAIDHHASIWEELRGQLEDGGIYLFSVGMLSKVLISDALKVNSNITCIDTGSSFDPIFLGNTRTMQAPQVELRKLYADILEPLVPKRIFTVWLSEDEGLPPLIEKCVASQRAVEGYEHHVIGLKDCPKGVPYLDAALAAKKWVKACDWLRINELIERGGIYCDADVEILSGKNFDDMLDYSLFAGKEENGFVSTAVMGSMPSHPLLKAHLEEVVTKFRGDDDLNFESSLEIITPRIFSAAKEDPGVVVYAPEYFYPYNHQTGVTNVTPNSRTFHHFMKSWVKDQPVVAKVEARIPRRIFTIWLSEDGSIPPVMEKCITSQKAVLGYEHQVLTLKDCPKGIPYLDAAIAAKKWVNASDYFRLHELIEKGGIYLDADVEVLPGKNFDDMLVHSLFTGAGEDRWVGNTVIGSIPGHPLLREQLREMAERFKGDNDSPFAAATEAFTPKVYAARGKNGVAIYLPEYFLPYNHLKGTINVTGNTRTFHHSVKSWVPDGDYRKTDHLPRVSFLLPTLGRPDGTRRCLESIDRLYYPKHLIHVEIDDGPGTVPCKVNSMYRAAAALPHSPSELADTYAFAANDMEFTPYSIYHAALASKEHALVSFNAGELLPDKGNICEHFLIRKDLVEKLGEIFSELLHHCGCDNLLWAKATRLGEAFRCEEATIIHHHFTKGAKMDDVYKRGWSHVDSDRAILAEELEKLAKMPS